MAQEKLAKSWHDTCPNSQKKCQISFAHNQLPARLQNTQHHVEEDSERIKNVGTVRARGVDSSTMNCVSVDGKRRARSRGNRSTDGAQKESRRERRIRHVQAQQQAEAACGDLTKAVDSNTMKCVSVDGKGRARTAVVGPDVSDGDKGDDGGGDGGDDGGGDGGEDGGGPGSSGSDGAMHRWLWQTETAEAAPAAGLPAAKILDDAAAATAKVSSLVTGRRHPLPSDRVAKEQQAIDRTMRKRQSLRDSIHAMQASTLAINQALELAASDRSYPDQHCGCTCDPRAERARIFIHATTVAAPPVLVPTHDRSKGLLEVKGASHGATNPGP